MIARIVFLQPYERIGYIARAGFATTILTNVWAMIEQQGGVLLRHELLGYIPGTIIAMYMVVCGKYSADRAERRYTPVLL